jgi:hypothetical protein
MSQGQLSILESFGGNDNHEDTKVTKDKTSKR